MEVPLSLLAFVECCKKGVPTTVGSRVKAFEMPRGLWVVWNMFR